MTKPRWSTIGLWSLALLSCLLMAVSVAQRWSVQASAPRSSIVELPSDLPTVDATRLQHRGKPVTPLVLIEFSDFQCPYCGVFARGALQQIERDLVDSGKVGLLFAEYPLEDIHADALAAAEAAECAGRQNRFWDFHDYLFRHQEQLSTNDLIQHAKALRLAADPFVSCMSDPESAHAIAASVTLGLAVGVRGTPSVFIGRMLPNGFVRLLIRLTGTPTAEDVELALQAPALTRQR